jgi:ATP-dependent DNA helicase DinG
VGTGKSFAYLIPGVAQFRRNGLPLLVATRTIPLQEQLIGKDLPMVERLLGVSFPYRLAKGREHYLCPARLSAFLQRAPDPGRPPSELQPLVSWARRTRTGDRAEAPPVPETLWQALNWSAQGPCARRCTRPETCPSFAERQSWQHASGVLVTNHHQFFADMALRASGGHLFALPGAIVLDEAHAVIDAARDVLGHQTELTELAAAAQAAARQLSRREPLGPTLMALAERFLDALTPQIDWAVSEETTRFAIRCDEGLIALSERLLDTAIAARELLGGMPETPARETALARLERATAPLHGILRPIEHLAWVEGEPRRRQAQRLVSAPRDLAALFQARLFGREAPVVLTSATLSVGGDFGYLERALGLENPLTCSVGTPFDLARQTRLYMPSDLPDPSEDADAFYAAALRRLEALLEATRGRALLLYTARRRAAQAAKHLKAWGRFPILHQERPTADLLDRFREEGPSVLLGTAYWEGIDVPGEPLSCVVVVKLPFPPSDPVLEAERAQAIARGEDPFEAVLLPQMLLKLRQGTGRLIRRASDRGVIAILDPRATTRRYRDRIRESLPDAPELASLDDVGRFLSEPHSG